MSVIFTLFDIKYVINQKLDTFKLFYVSTCNFIMKHENIRLLFDYDNFCK